MGVDVRLKWVGLLLFAAVVQCRFLPGGEDNFFPEDRIDGFKTGGRHGSIGRGSCVKYDECVDECDEEMMDYELNCSSYCDLMRCDKVAELSPLHKLFMKIYDIENPAEKFLKRIKDSTITSHSRSKNRPAK